MTRDTVIAVLDPKTAKRLQRLERKAHEATLELDAAIAESHEAGASFRELEAVLSVSHQAASNAVKRHRARQEAGG
jgi:hypothetical protein